MPISLVCLDASFPLRWLIGGGKDVIAGTFCPRNGLLGPMDRANRCSRDPLHNMAFPAFPSPTGHNEL
jgi:hypothetical protein